MRCSRQRPRNILTLKAPTLEPYALFKALTGNRQRVDANLFHNNRKKSKFGSALFWIRSNFFIPDARILWTIPSLFKLSKFLKTGAVDVIISTGPPHTAHVIAHRLSKKFNIPWLADFRDAWTKIDYFEKLKLSSIARKIHQKWERKILTAADCVVTVSPYHANELSKIAKRQVNVITNGFDEDHFSNSPQAHDEKFTIVHTGMLSESRNHAIFWEALTALVQENDAFRDVLEVRFYGKADPAVAWSVTPALADKVFICDYVDHDEIPDILGSAQILYLPIHDCAVDVGFLPGKLFEYLAARRPIISIGPAMGDTAHLIHDLKAGYSFEYHEQEALKQCLQECFRAFQNKTPYIMNADIDQYTRKNLTGKLAGLLNQIAHTKLA
jgi:glycosyltransferase involved in cell wall biosynthesis